MSYGIEEVSKHRPCPVCGKTDWCGFMKNDKGYEVVICKRDIEHQNVIGADGNFYIYVAQSRSDNSIFQEATQRKLQQEEWEAEHGTKVKKDSQEFKAAAVKKVEYKVEDEILPKTNKELDKIYRYLLELLVLDEEHRQYLIKEKWDEQLIASHNIKSFPERDFTRFKYKNFFSKNLYRKKLAGKILEKFGPNALLGVPGAYIDKQGNWTFEGPKGIVFPLYDAEGYIYRLRIRMDFTDVNKQLKKENNYAFYEDGFGKHILVPFKGFYTLEKTENGVKEVFEKTKGKYRNLSSYQRDRDAYNNNIIKNAYNKGCQSGNQLGYYYNTERDNMYICFVTEGEKKGIFCNAKLHAPFISVPGVNSWSKLFEGEKGKRGIDILKQRGVKMFIVAYDSDKETNSKVLDCEAGVVDALKKEGFAVGIANWNSQLGKGIDDLLANGFQPEYTLV